MAIWKRIGIYVGYLLAGLVVTLMLMGKNHQTVAYVGEIRLDTLPSIQVEEIATRNPGQVSMKSSFVVNGNRILTVNPIVGIFIFFIPIPLIFLLVAHRFISSGQTLLVSMAFLAAGIFASIMLIYSIPRR